MMTDIFRLLQVVREKSPRISLDYQINKSRHAKNHVYFFNVTICKSSE